MPIYLVVDNNTNHTKENNDTYHRIMFTGYTFDEVAFKAWVRNTWCNPNIGRIRKIAEDAPITEYVKACATGGWEVLIKI